MFSRYMKKEPVHLCFYFCIIQQKYGTVSKSKKPNFTKKNHFLQQKQKSSTKKLSTYIGLRHRTNSCTIV